MFTVEIADLRISINNKYDHVKELCAPYICDDGFFDFTVTASENEIKGQRKFATDHADSGMLESLCIYRNIAKLLPKYNAFVMHGAVIEYEGDAYCFTAKSGTGKTTHIMLWRKLLGNKVNVINGDKPIMRLINGRWYAYGTPWCGKEKYGRNAFAPLKGICFLNQAPDNAISRLTTYNALNGLIRQIYMPIDIRGKEDTLNLIDNMLSNVPIWTMNCNISNEAAELSFRTMCRKG